MTVVLGGAQSDGTSQLRQAAITVPVGTCGTIFSQALYSDVSKKILDLAHPKTQVRTRRAEASREHAGREKGGEDRSGKRGHTVFL